MEYIVVEGLVSKIKFYNDKSNFIVLELKISDDKKTTVTGVGFDILKNDFIKITGNFVTKKYKGKIQEQFDARRIERIIPKEEEKILEYLSSGIVKGISKKIAENIVDVWGEESLDIIENKPHMLKKIKGLGSKKIAQIINSWDECKPQDETINSLIKLGFNSFESISIYKHFKEESLQKILEQPYYVYKKIKNISFEKIDSIAIKNKTPKNDISRIKTGIDFALVNLHNTSGETIVYKQQLIFSAAKILRIQQNDIINAIDSCIEDSILYVVQNDPEYFQHYTVYEAELEVAQKIFYLHYNTEGYNNAKISDIIKIERKGEKKIEFVNEQKTAILNSVNNKISILTGKPGTGKTTVTNEIVKQLENLGKYNIILCAPTGKAAQKMSESTGKKAKTIHRLLEYNPQTKRFDKNIKNPLEADVLIIDEASMVDIFLMANLIRAISNKTQVVIIGDVNQLSSVGLGSVLRDLIQSGAIPTAYLNEPMRTGKNSEIITVSHSICDYGLFNVNSSKNIKSDIYFIETNSDKKTFDMIDFIIKNKTEKSLGFSNYHDLQILTPIHKGIIGTENLNNTMKYIINDKIELEEDFIQYKNYKYHKHDKIIQIKNNYDKDIYNGDSGIISEVGYDYVNILFDDKEVFFKKNELNQILPAWAISIHKSQGSEYPLVIIPIPQDPSEFIDRSLIYTGITRGKKTVIMIGNKETIDQSCMNQKNRLRKTNLEHKIKSLFLKDYSLNNTVANQVFC